MDVATNEPEKLPCGLEDDDLCWVAAVLTCPPCEWRDEQCWESFEDAAGDKVEEMTCEEQDFECYKAFMEDHPDLMPCKPEGDDECWGRFLEENPPCEEEDMECWKSFKDTFDPEGDKWDEGAGQEGDRRGEKGDRGDGKGNSTRGEGEGDKRDGKGDKAKGGKGGFFKITKT